MATGRTAIITACAVALLCAGLYLYLGADDPSHVVVFSTWGTPAEIDGFRGLIDRYNATRHPRHPVKLSHSEQYQYTERLLVQSAALAGPDIIHLDRKDVPLFAHKGLLADLTTMIEGDAAFASGVFFPGLVDGCTIGGHTYALPHSFSTLVLYYNRDHFDAAHVPYPDSSWTWETLVDAAQKLTGRDPGGNIVRYGCLMQIAFSTILEQNGGHLLNPALDSCVVSSPECADALRFEADLSEKYHVSWSMLSQNLLWDDMFAGGRLSMIANGRWAAVPYVRALGAGTVDVAPLPRGRFRKGAAAVHVMAISSESAHKSEALDFIRFLVSEEGEQMVTAGGAAIPARRSVANSDAYMRHPLTPGMNNRVFLDELPGSVAWPFAQGPYLTTFTLQSSFERAMRRVLLHDATPEESLRAMQDEINGDIALQRRMPRGRPFAGSIFSWGLAGVCACGIAAVWQWRVRRRRSGELPGNVDGE